MESLAPEFIAKVVFLPDDERRALLSKEYPDMVIEDTETHSNIVKDGTIIFSFYKVPKEIL